MTKISLRKGCSNQLSVSLSATVLAMACMAAGCAGTDIGNPVSDPRDIGGASASDLYCDEDANKLDASEEAPSGMLAKDFPRWLAGKHNLELVWGDGKEADQGSEVTLQLDILGPVYYIGRTLNEDGQKVGLQVDACPDIARTAVSIIIVSADGKLNETLETFIDVDGEGLATATVSIALQEIKGTLSQVKVSLPDDSTLKKSKFILHFQQFGKSVSGELRLVHTFASSKKDNERLISHEASFSDGQYCGLGSVGVKATDKVVVSEIDGIIAAVNALNEEPIIKGVDGEATPLKLLLSAPSEFACVGIPNQQTMALRFGGKLSLLANNGIVDSQVPLSIEVSGPGTTEAGMIAMGILRKANTAADLTSLIAEFGIQDPLDTRGYEGGFVSVRNQVLDGVASGSFNVHGYEPCAGNSPCQNTETLLWQMTW